MRGPTARGRSSPTARGPTTIVGIQQVRDPLRGQRFGEEVALGHVAAHLLKEGRLLLGFHPFCYDLHPEGVRQLHDHPH